MDFNQEAFFSKYVSLLRIQSNINDLCDFKSHSTIHQQNKSISRNFLLAHTDQEMHKIGT
jgi:hypothetical protein